MSREARSLLKSSIAAAGAISSFFPFPLFGPNCARSARANRRERAADGLFERNIGTAGILGLRKCPETAALGNGNCQSRFALCLFPPRSTSRSRKEEGEARGIHRGRRGSEGSSISCSLFSRERASLLLVRHRRRSLRIESITRTEGAALRWAAKATCL